MKNMTVDSLVEVRIHLFKRGEVLPYQELENLTWLGFDYESKCTDVQDRSPAEGMEIIISGRNPDDLQVMVDEDMFAFQFGEFHSGTKDSGVGWMVSEAGWDDTLEGWRDDIRKLFGNNPPYGESIITAWSFWSNGGRGGFDDDSYECGVELLGRVNMASIEYTMEPVPDKPASLPVKGLFS